jgi:Mu-like prophage major head subunit gpT
MTIKTRSTTRTRGYNPETREAVYSIASSTPVRTYDYRIGWFMETLSMNPAHVDMTRFSQGMPLLKNHDRWDLDSRIGVVVNPVFEGENLLGTVRVSEAEETNRYRIGMADGTYVDGSVGYTVDTYEEITLPDAEIRSFLATRWQPHEYSLTTVPADPTSKQRGDQEGSQAEPKFITLDEIKERTVNVQNKPGTSTAGPDDAQIQAAAAEQARLVAEASQRAMLAERTRAADIRDVATRAGLPAEFAEAQITAGATIDHVRALAIDEIAKKQKETSMSTSHITVTENGNLRKALGDVLHARINNTSHKLEGQAKEWAGARILDIASAIAETQGIQSFGRDPNALVKRALHTSSEFPLLMTSAVSRTLRDQYISQARWYEGLVTEGTMTDFRPTTNISLSGFPNLVKLNEAGEVEGGSINMTAQSMKLDTWARMIGFTRQMLINDDLGSITRVVRTIASSLSRLENKVVSASYLGNPVMQEDNNALFSVPHNNLLTGPTSALSITAISEANKRIRQMQNLNGENMDMTARYLVVGSALEDVARQLLAPINATTNAAVNIYSGRLEIKVDTRIDALGGGLGATAWFLFASPQDSDVLHLNRLAGQESATVDTKDGWDTLGMEMRVVYDLAGGVMDYRGALMSNGQ